MMNTFMCGTSNLSAVNGWLVNFASQLALLLSPSRASEKT